MNEILLTPHGKGSQRAVILQHDYFMLKFFFIKINAFKKGGNVSFSVYLTIKMHYSYISYQVI